MTALKVDKFMLVVLYLAMRLQPERVRRMPQTEQGDLLDQALGFLVHLHRRLHEVVCTERKLVRAGQRYRPPSPAAGGAAGAIASAAARPGDEHGTEA